MRGTRVPISILCWPCRRHGGCWKVVFQGCEAQSPAWHQHVTLFERLQALRSPPPRTNSRTNISNIFGVICRFFSISLYNVFFSVVLFHPCRADKPIQGSIACCKLPLDAVASARSAAGMIDSYKLLGFAWAKNRPELPGRVQFSGSLVLLPPAFCIKDRWSCSCFIIALCSCFECFFTDAQLTMEPLKD